MNEGVIGKKIKKTKWEFFRRIRYCKLNIIRKRGDVKHWHAAHAPEPISLLLFCRKKLSGS